MIAAFTGDTSFYGIPSVLTASFSTSANNTVGLSSVVISDLVFNNTEINFVAEWTEQFDQSSCESNFNNFDVYLEFNFILLCI